MRLTGPFAMLLACVACSSSPKPADGGTDVAVPIDASADSDAAACVLATQPVSLPCNGGCATGSCCVTTYTDVSSCGTIQADGGGCDQWWGCVTQHDCAGSHQVCCMSAVTYAGTCPLTVSEFSAPQCQAACSAAAPPVCSTQADCTGGTVCTPATLDAMDTIVVGLCL